MEPIRPNDKAILRDLAKRQAEARPQPQYAGAEKGMDAA